LSEYQAKSAGFREQVTERRFLWMNCQQTLINLKPRSTPDCALHSSKTPSLCGMADVIQVLQNYPSAMLVISHDVDFLTAIGVTDWYDLKDGLLSLKA